jgi:hypothetical protein
LGGLVRLNRHAAFVSQIGALIVDLRNRSLSLPEVLSFANLGDRHKKRLVNADFSSISRFWVLPCEVRYAPFDIALAELSERRFQLRIGTTFAF